MDRFQELEVFVAVAERGGLAKAAAELRSSPPAVTRALAALEQRLGIQLVNRTTRKVHLTEAGQRLLPRARQLLADLETAEAEAAGLGGTPAGHLRITASVTMGRMLLPTVVTSFLRAQPRVTAELLLLDRVVDLVEEGIDLGLRVGQLPDSSLVARQVGQVVRLLVASPAYLARRGVPMTPVDLAQHSIIVFTGLMRNREWSHKVGEANARIALVPWLEINDAPAAIAAAEAGEGITIALSYMVAEQIRAGLLVPVLAAHAPSPVPVQLVYPTSRLVAPKVRAFIDHAAPLLKAALDDLRPVSIIVRQERLT